MKNEKNIKKVSLFIVCIVIISILATMFGLNQRVPENDPTTEVVTEVTTESTTEEVIISNEVEELAQDTIDMIEDGESIESEDIITGDNAKDAKSDEITIEDEQAIEQDAVVEQEDISYDGTNKGNGSKLLGKPTGPICYLQLDSRWGSLPYTSCGNKSQTIKSSGCGPTSAAMVVSASKGAILPPTMAKLFVDNGYRTKNNGTAWSAWSFVADYFNFKEYHSTSSFTTMKKYLKQDKNKDGVSDYFVVASCGSGLFTSSGHYIVLFADVNNVITVHDPYYYSGKFNTASRKAARVKMNGNIAKVSEASFKKYGNVKNYWIFSNDYVKPSGTKPGTTKPKNTSTTKKTMYVTNVSTSLNVRKSPSTKSTIVGSLKNKSKVTVYETKNGWSRIGTDRWVSSSYLTSKTPTKSQTVTYKTTVGKSYRLKSDCTLNTQGNFKGTNCNYLALTECKVLTHYSSTVDKVQIVKTGKIRYVKVSNFKL